MLEEINSALLSVVNDILARMGHEYIHNTVKIKVAKVVEIAINDFVRYLREISQSQYRFCPTVEDARYCLGVLCREFQLRWSPLMELEMSDSVVDSTMDEEGSLYSTSSESSENDDESDFDEDDDQSLDSDEEESVDSNEDININIFSSKESSLSGEDSDPIVETLHHHLVSFFYDSQTELPVSITELLVKFLSHQLELSFSNSSDSIFIRAGYPAFGIVNTLYQYHDALKQKQDLLEFQSHLAEKVDRYDKEVVDTSKIVDGLTSLVHTLRRKDSISFDENMDFASNEAMPNEFNTPLLDRQVLVDKSPVVYDGSDIENLKTALKAERQEKSRLRDKHAEIKSLISRLNLLAGELDAEESNENTRLTATHETSADDNEQNRALRGSQHSQELSAHATGSRSRVPIPRQIDFNTVIDENKSKSIRGQGQVLQSMSFSPPSVFKRETGNRKRTLSMYATSSTADVHTLFRPEQLQEALLGGNQQSQISAVKRRRASSERLSDPHTPSLFDR